MQFHRLHCVLLFALGYTAKEIADAFNHGQRTIECWVQQYRVQGESGLLPKESGRKSKLRGEELECVMQDLKQAPVEFGYACRRWTGKLLQRHLEEHYDIQLETRQCQRIMKKITKNH